MTSALRLSIFGVLLATGVAWSAPASWAGDEATESAPKDSDMTIEEATDNLVEDSKKAGKEIAEGAEDAADWTEEKVKEATD